MAPADEVIERLRGEVGSSSLKLCGNGIAPYRETLISGLDATLLPETANAPCPFWMSLIGHNRIAEKGPDDLDTVEPVYVREPDARLPQKKQQ